MWWLCSIAPPRRLRALCLRAPAEHDALRRDDGAVERDSEQRRDEDPRPRRLELEDLGVGVDEHTERIQRAAEVLADDRADHREHARNLQRGEEEGERARHADAAPDLELA